MVEHQGAAGVDTDDVVTAPRECERVRARSAAEVGYRSGRCNHIRELIGGPLDGILSRLLDVVWAFPVYLLAISLSTVLIARGFSIGPLKAIWPRSMLSFWP